MGGQAAFQELLADTPRRLLRTGIALNTNDPKLPSGKPVVYAIEADRAKAEQACDGKAEVHAFKLEDAQKYFMRNDAVHGLLYLPYPYLVPGGRFNEMYGWDTAFPVFAWADSHPRMMREQADNQLYQIRAYGKVLNANRSYYLSRSQPPLIGAMAHRVWMAALSHGWRSCDPDGVYADEVAWLSSAYADLESYYNYWTTGERVAYGSGLSRYWDEGDTQAIEVVKGEPGHYEHAIKHFQSEPDERFYKDGKLTPLYYRADRAMRASGLDPTGHWGYGGLQCIFHAPVCLNSLLYRMEGDMAEIAHILAKDAAPWKDRRQKRLSTMRRLMFDGESGQYQDYDFENQRRNAAPFGTFFHALWAGVYDDDHATAARAARGILEKLETPHGISTSTRASGSQWDHPYGWPPLQYFAFAGLARCGLHDDAKRIAGKFVTLAMRVHASHGALFEKYNVQEGNPEVNVMHGYNINVSEQGTFLWTAATLKLAQDCLT